MEGPVDPKSIGQKNFRFGSFSQPFLWSNEQLRMFCQTIEGRRNPVARGEVSVTAFIYRSILSVKTRNAIPDEHFQLAWKNSYLFEEFTERDGAVNAILLDLPERDFRLRGVDGSALTAVRILGLAEPVDWQVTDGLITVRLPERMPVSPAHVLVLEGGARPAG